MRAGTVKQNKIQLLTTIVIWESSDLDLTQISQLWPLVIKMPSHVSEADNGACLGWTLWALLLPHTECSGWISPNCWGNLCFPDPVWPPGGSFAGGDRGHHKENFQPLWMSQSFCFLRTGKAWVAKWWLSAQDEPSPAEWDLEICAAALPGSATAQSYTPHQS